MRNLEAPPARRRRSVIFAIKAGGQLVTMAQRALTGT
jgi:hypothetical protein